MAEKGFCGYEKELLRLRPNEPNRPARTPVMRPVLEETRVETRPKPVGFTRPTPVAAPVVRPEKMVGRRTGV